MAALCECTLLSKLERGRYRLPGVRHQGLVIMEENAYQALGLENGPDASDVDIKKAYRKLVSALWLFTIQAALVTVRQCSWANPSP